LDAYGLNLDDRKRTDCFHHGGAVQRVRHGYWQRRSIVSRHQATRQRNRPALVFPQRDRKKELLDTTYNLNCTEGTGIPTVVDVFPRNAAINIVDTRYKDQDINIGWLLSFFGFGFNGSYNREHLQMTQLLGQSSYITGYGVGQSHFGWKFGIPLGDQVISSDIKRTFALVRVPDSCKSPTVDFDHVWWGRPEKGPKVDEAATVATKATLEQQLAKVDAVMKASDPATGATSAQKVLSLDFNRTAFDPTKYSPSSPVFVSLAARFAQPLDQQTLIYANGILIKRARDTFGRGVAVTGTATPGLLEASSLATANTWMPTSSTSILMVLDGGQFGQTFPSIMVVPPTPTGSIAIGPAIPVVDDKHTNATVTVSGKAYLCAGSCQLPSLAYAVPGGARVGAARLKQSANANDAMGVIITRTDVSSAPAATAATLPTALQLVSGSEQQMWGTNAEVYAASDNVETRIQCSPSSSSGSRLICELAPDTGMKDLKIHVLDIGHTGGAIEAWTELPGCSVDADCYPPTAWGTEDPQWNYKSGNDAGWEFKVKFVNLTDTVGGHAHQATIRLGSATVSQDLVAANGGRVHTATFTILPAQMQSWSDQMQLSLDTDQSRHWRLLNLKSMISPIASNVTADSTSWAGQNMIPIYNYLELGTGASASDMVPITCLMSSCSVQQGSLPFKKSGIMYLANPSNPHVEVPLMQSSAAGTLSAVNFKYTDPNAKPQPAQAQAQVTPPPPVTVAPPPAPPAGVTAQPVPTNNVNPAQIIKHLSTEMIQTTP